MSVNNVNCCVLGCHSKKGKDPNLSFHKFPEKNGRFVYIMNRLGITEKLDRHQAWILKLKLGRPVTKYMKVCSLHFTRDDFILPDIRSKRPRLKVCALPSRNLPETGDIFHRKSPRRAQQPRVANGNQPQGCDAPNTNPPGLKLADARTHNEVSVKSGIAEGVELEWPKITDVRTGPEDNEIFIKSEIEEEEMEFEFPKITDVRTQLEDDEIFIKSEITEEEMELESPRMGDVRTQLEDDEIFIKSEVAEEEEFEDFSNTEQEADQTLENFNAPKDPIKVSSGGKIKSFVDTITTDKELYTMTGISSLRLFNGIVKKCEEYFRKFSNKSDPSLKERVLMTLMKLKNGFNYSVLSVLFKSVSAPVCRRIFNETIVLLAKILGVVIYWPSIEVIKRNTPSCFKKPKIVIDCTEIPVQRANSIKSRKRTYSDSKKKYTIKFMTAVTPGGLITFVSKGYGGRCSNKTMFQQSGLVKTLEMFGDEIIIDKGFLIQDIADDCCVGDTQAPSLTKQLTGEQTVQNQKVAEARAHHFQRFNQKLKTFDIFNKPLPVSLWSKVDDIFITACAIANLSSQRSQDCKFTGD